MKKRILRAWIAVLFIASLLTISHEGFRLVNNFTNHRIVVIDAGHGGSDPGKVGVGDVLEKDVNLAIAGKLKALLEQNDITVIMTRESDTGLYSESDSNKKNADMRKRIEIMETSKPDAIVSIHQNSYPQADQKGAQVFYHVQSLKAKELAELIQTQLIKDLDTSNRRQAKSNDSYYLLKHSSAPMVIVECGFLSNYEETALLTSDAYQEKTAYAIHMGILQFLNISAP